MLLHVATPSLQPSPKTMKECERKREIRKKTKECPDTWKLLQNKSPCLGEVRIVIDQEKHWYSVKGSIACVRVLCIQINFLLPCQCGKKRFRQLSTNFKCTYFRFHPSPANASSWAINHSLRTLTTLQEVGIKEPSVWIIWGTRVQTTDVREENHEIGFDEMCKSSCQTVIVLHAHNLGNQRNNELHQKLIIFFFFWRGGGGGEGLQVAGECYWRRKRALWSRMASHWLHQRFWNISRFS